MNFLNKWKDKATEFIDVRVQLLKLNVVEKASSVLGYIMLSIILLFMSLAVLIFLGISLQETFIKLFDENRIAGSFATFGLFVVLMLILFLARKGIVNTFAGIFIRIMTDPGDDDDEDLKKEAQRYRREMGLDDEEEVEKDDQLRGKKVPVS